MSVLKSGRVRVAVCSLVLASLAACGGGGGGSSGTDAEQTSSSVSLSGVAAKGVMKNAIVKAFAVTPNGVKGAQIGATQRTDNAGHYTVSGLPAGAVLLLEVSVDEQTRMADEATGLDLVPPSNFVMRATKVLTNQGADVLQVTPFSEMAVAMALQNGGLTADVVDAANQKVVAFVSYPVLTAEPAFKAGYKPANPSGVLLAAVSKLAFDDGIDACKAVDAPAAKVACVVTALSTIGAGDDQLIAKLESAKTAMESGYDGDVVPPLVKQSPVLLTSSVRDAITEAKALIRNVRANAEKTTADQVVQRFTTVADEVKGNVSPIDDSNQLLVVAAAKAVAVLANPQRELGSFASADFLVRLGMGHDDACTMFSDAQATVRATSFQGVQVIKCTVGLSSQYAGSNWSAISSSWTMINFSHELVVSRTAVSGQYTVKSTLFQQPVVHERTYAYSGDLGGVFVVDYGRSTSQDIAGERVVLSPEMIATASASTLVNGDLDRITLSGDMAPGVAAGVVTQGKVAVNIDLSTQAVAGDLTRLNLAGRFTAFKDGVEGVSVALKSGSYIQAKTQVLADVYSGLAEDLSGSAVHLLIEATHPQGNKVTGTLDVSDFVNNAQRSGPRQAVFSGTLTQAGGATLFAGKVRLNAPVNPVPSPNQLSEVYVDWTATVEGRLPIPSRPDLILSVAVTEPASGRYGFSGSYQQGTDKILVSGSINESNPDAEWLTLATPSGVTVTAHHKDASLDIKKGNDVIGVFARSNSKIVYADNSYEQF